MQRRVLKIGGSLLLRPDLRASVKNWLRLQGTKETFVVVGGGKTIDAIRELDDMWPSDTSDVHWLCIELLQATLFFAHRVFPDWNIVRTADELMASSQKENEPPRLVAVDAFYRRDAGPPDQECGLPETWGTTTDSLAAFLAHRVQAHELVLLKSCKIPDVSHTDLASMGIVDSVFPQAASRIPNVRICRLHE